MQRPDASGARTPPVLDKEDEFASSSASLSEVVVSLSGSLKDSLGSRAARMHERINSAYSINSPMRSSVCGRCRSFTTCRVIRASSRSKRSSMKECVGMTGMVMPGDGVDVGAGINT